MAEANVSKNNPPMEDIWRVEIGQIIIRFRTNKPKGALCVWQNLVSQLSTLLNGCFETEALVLWKMLLNAIPELLRTSHIAETQTLWRSLTETVLEIRAVGYSQTASAMWKTLLAMAPKLLAEFPNGVTELMWTEVCQTAAEMESGASDPERTPLPASPSPSPLPLPTASPALTSSPVQPPPPLPSRSRSPLPTLSIPEPGPPAGLSPGSSPKRLSPIPSPKRPSPAPSPTRSSPGDPRQSRFDPRRTPLPPPPVQQLPSAQAPVTSAPSPALTQSTSPSPSPSPTTAQYLPPKPRPISQSGLQETQHSKPPKPKVKPKPLLANRKTFTAPSLAPSIQPAPRPVVKQQPLVVTQSGDQVSTTDSEWDQGMQQVLTELSHRGIGDLQRGRRTGRMGNVRPKSCQNPTDDFLTDLYQIPMDDLSGLCDIVHEHAKHNFYPYKVYCAHKWHQDRCLQQLTERSSPLAALLSRLEMSPEVRGLGLAALLHLPVQHVQRLPMMMEAVLKRMPPDHPERQSCEEAHRALTKLVKDCDEDAAREEERLVSKNRLSAKNDRVMHKASS
ncbi:Rho guanine nucleotide exchange factor 26 [Amphibalanus amphitrite]|uniref:Rho guanine nucleotide exchange factor 26 n=1 Tax=Amphibalanus amphitrite TaxID=1232801 RepID=A0A6A4VUG0_AMPAM|nr:Rho guanine nucleotide exchange factor 26 [Amphibalanus amphitrite]